MKLKIQRYFVLLSSKGVPVLSSLIARAKKPVTGEWMEVNLRPCCSVKVAIGTPSGSETTITVSCGTDKLADLTVASIVPATIVELLNSTFPAIGEFSQDGDFYYLKTTVCPSPSISVAYA